MYLVEYVSYSMMLVNLCYILLAMLATVSHTSVSVRSREKHDHQVALRALMCKREFKDTPG